MESHDQKKSEISRIYIIADTHFGDDDIRLYEERPFPDTARM